MVSIVSCGWSILKKGTSFQYRTLRTEHISVCVYGKCVFLIVLRWSYVNYVTGNERT